MFNIDLAVVEEKTYRFKSGQFAGLTLQTAFLRYPADAYDLVFQDQSNKPPAKEFRKLWNLIRKAKASVKCGKDGCKRSAIAMSFEAVDSQPPFDPNLIEPIVLKHRMLRRLRQLAK